MRGLAMPSLFVFLLSLRVGHEPLKVEELYPPVQLEDDDEPWYEKLPLYPEKTLEEPPGLRYTLALCPVDTIDDPDLEKKAWRRLKAATTQWRLMCHHMTRPVRLDNCYEDPAIPGYIYVDVLDLSYDEGLVGSARPIDIGGFTVGGFVQLGIEKIHLDEVLIHEVGHIFGYEHSRKGVMAPALDIMDGDPSMAGTSACNPF